jgi:Zn-dependent protease with chaperone function
MTYWTSAAAVALSSFTIVAALTSAGVALAAPRLARRLARYAPASRAGLLFRVRLLPAVVAALWGFGVALPIFLWFEPRNTNETFARTLIGFGVVGLLLIGRGAWRAVGAWRATRVVMRGWQQRGRRLDVAGIPMPVFAIDESFPTVAVVGFSRPALFIAERLLRECSEDEVRAMMLHECAHVATRDNFKRFMIRACPDFVGTGGALDRAWACAAEEAADATAVAGQPASALDLAQALIRVARLAPRPSPPVLASAFYFGGSIEARVRRLVEPSTAPEFTRPLGSVMVCSIALLAGLVVLAAPTLHQLTEHAVRLLP